MKNKLFLFVISIFFTFGVLTTIALSADAPRMTTEELKAILGNPDLTILDLRLGNAWTESDLKIKGAVREDPENIGPWANKYAKDKTLVLYCT
jgi:rhodanese-related sulfurtransferase